MVLPKLVLTWSINKHIVQQHLFAIENETIKTTILAYNNLRYGRW